MSPATVGPPSRTRPLLRDGYALLDGFLDATEIPAVRADIERLLRAPRDPSCERPHNTLVPLRWDDPIVDRLLGDLARTERLRAAIDAGDLRWISGYVSVKHPRSLPLWWHQDWWCWDHPVSYRREPAQVAVLCYLTDTDAHRGALRVLPGSHARSIPLHAVLPAAHADPATALDANHPAMAAQPGQATIAVRAGDAVVLDYRLLHGTHANAGPHRRDGLLMSFAPNWDGLPPDIRGHLISHPALPTGDEAPPAGGWAARLLPRFDGPRRDLALNRDAPAAFAIGEI